MTNLFDQVSSIQVARYLTSSGENGSKTTVSTDLTDATKAFSNGRKWLVLPSMWTRIFISPGTPRTASRCKKSISRNSARARRSGESICRTRRSSLVEVQARRSEPRENGLQSRASFKCSVISKGIVGRPGRSSKTSSSARENQIVQAKSTPAPPIHNIRLVSTLIVWPSISYGCQDGGGMRPIQAVLYVQEFAPEPTCFRAPAATACAGGHHHTSPMSRRRRPAGGTAPRH